MQIATENSSQKIKDRIFKRGSVTYYYSSLFFKGQVKKDVFSLYAYVREVDDQADDLTPNVKALNHYWDQTLAAWDGGETGNPIIDDFVELAKRKEFQWEWIEAFWQSMRTDLKKTYYKSFNQLEKYMYGSAEVIGLMMARVIDLPDKSHSAARMLGKSMQFINIVRDVDEDLEMGRNYLGFSKKQKNNQKEWSCFIKEQVEIYDQMQKEAEAGYEFIRRRHLIPIKTAADMYKWTAKKIYQNPAVVWQKKIKPSKLRVIATILWNSVTV